MLLLSVTHKNQPEDNSSQTGNSLEEDRKATQTKPSEKQVTQDLKAVAAAKLPQS